MLNLGRNRSFTPISMLFAKIKKGKGENSHTGTMRLEPSVLVRRAQVNVGLLQWTLFVELYFFSIIKMNLVKM